MDTSSPATSSQPEPSTAVATEESTNTTSATTMVQDGLKQPTSGENEDVIDAAVDANIDMLASISSTIDDSTIDMLLNHFTASAVDVEDCAGGNREGESLKGGESQDPTQEVKAAGPPTEIAPAAADNTELTVNNNRTEDEEEDRVVAAADNDEVVDNDKDKHDAVSDVGGDKADDEVDVNVLANDESDDAVNDEKVQGDIDNAHENDASVVVDEILNDVDDEQRHIEIEPSPSDVYPVIVEEMTVTLVGVNYRNDAADDDDNDHDDEKEEEEPESFSVEATTPSPSNSVDEADVSLPLSQDVVEENEEDKEMEAVFPAVSTQPKDAANFGLHCPTSQDEADNDDDQSNNQVSQKGENNEDEESKFSQVTNQTTTAAAVPLPSYDDDAHVNDNDDHDSEQEMATNKEEITYDDGCDTKEVVPIHQKHDEIVLEQIISDEQEEAIYEGILDGHSEDVCDSAVDADDIDGEYTVNMTTTSTAIQDTEKDGNDSKSDNEENVLSRKADQSEIVLKDARPFEVADIVDGSGHRDILELSNCNSASATTSSKTTTADDPDPLAMPIERLFVGQEEHQEGGGGVEVIQGHESMSYSHSNSTTAQDDEEADQDEYHQYYNDLDEAELREFLSVGSQPRPDEEYEHEACNNDESAVLLSTPERDGMTTTKPQSETIILEEENASLKRLVEMLQSTLAGLQNDKEIQDMYHDPYSSHGTDADQLNPSAPPTETTSSSFLPSQFLSTIGLMSSTGVRNNDVQLPDTYVQLQQELTELRSKTKALSSANQELASYQVALEKSKRRLKHALKAVEQEDKHKSELLSTLSKELGESTSREASLRSELDACKTKLDGYSKIIKNTTLASAVSNNATSEESNGRSQDNGLNTALTIAEKQNTALMAHNVELQYQNDRLQGKNKELQEKVAELENDQQMLSSLTSKGGNKNSNEHQLYGRYLQMKSSLSDMAGVLEEVNEQNQLLNTKVESLTKQLKESQIRATEVHNSTSTNEDLDDDQPHDETPSSLCKAREDSSQTNRGEDRISHLVEEVERYKREIAEERNTTEQLLSEISDLKKHEIALQDQLEATRKSIESSEIEQSAKLRAEVDELRKAMDQAADDSENLLSEMEECLQTTRKELHDVQAKAKKLDEEKQSLLAEISFVREERQQKDDQHKQQNHMRSFASNINELFSFTSEPDKDIELESLRESKRSVEDQLTQKQAEVKTLTEKLQLMCSDLAAEKERVAEMTRENDEANRKLREKVNCLEAEEAERCSNFSTMETLLQSTLDELALEREIVVELKEYKLSLESEMEKLQAAAVDSSLVEEETTLQLQTVQSELQSVRTELLAKQNESINLYSKNLLLEEQLGSLRERLDLASQSSAEERSVYEKQLTFVTQSMEESQGKLNEVENRCADLQSELEVVKAKFASTSDELVSVRQELKSSTNLLCVEREQTRSTLQAMISELEDKLKFLSSEKDELVKQFTAEKNIFEMKLNAVKNDLASEKEQVVAVVTHKQSIEAELASTKRELSSTVASLEQATNQVRQFDFEIIGLKEKLDEKTKKLDEQSVAEQKKSGELIAMHSAFDSLKLTMQSTTDESATRVLEANSQLVELKSELSGEKQKVENLTRFKEQLEEQLANVKNDLGFLTAECSSLKDERDVLAKRIEIIESELDTTKEALTILKAENDQLQNSLTEANDHANTAEAEFSKLERLNDEMDKTLKASRQEFAEIAKLRDMLQSELDANVEDLEKTANQRNEIVALLETAVEELAAEKEKVESRDVEATLFKKEISDLQVRINLMVEAEKSREEEALLTSVEIQTEMDALRAAKEAATLTAQELEASLRSVREQLTQKEAELEVSNTSFERLQADLESIKESSSSDRLARENVDQEAKKLQSKLADARNKYAIERRRVDDLAKKLFDMEREVRQHKDELKKAKEEAAKAKAELDNKTAAENWNLIAEQQKIEELTILNELMKSEIEQLQLSVENNTSASMKRSDEFEITKKELEKSSQRTDELKHALHELQTQLEESEESKRDLKTEVMELKDRLRDQEHTYKEELERVKNELKQANLRVEEYTKSEASMQFEVDALKEAMQTFNTSDREKLLATTREELFAAQKKVDELNKSKLSLESKLRAARQTVDSTKASAFVGQRETEMEISELKRELEVVLGENAELSKRMQAHDSEVEDLKSSHQHALAKQEERNSEVYQQNDELQAEIATMHGVLDNEKEINRKLALQVEDLEAAIKSLEKSKDMLLDQINQLEEEANSRRDTLESSNEMIESLQSMVDQLTVEKTKLANEKAQSVARDGEREMEHSQIKAELGKTKLDNKQLSDEISELKAKQQLLLDSHREALSTEERKRNELLAEFHSLESKHEELTALLKKESANNKEMTQKVVDMENRMTYLREEKESLMERNAALAHREQLQKESLSSSSEEITTLQSTINEFQSRFEYLAKQLQEAQEAQAASNNKVSTRDLQEFEFARSTWNAERDTLVLQIGTLQQQIQERRDAVEAARSDCEREKRRADDCESRESQYKSKLEDTTRELKACQAKLAEHQKKLKELRSQLKGDDSATQYSIARERDLQSKLQIKEQELSACKKTLSDEQYANSVYKDLITNLNKANDGLEAKKQSLADEIEKLKTKNANFADSIAKLQALNGSKDIEVADTQKMILEENDFLRSQKDKFVHDISKLDQRLDSMTNERDALQETAKRLQRRVDELCAANKNLEKELRAMESRQKGSVEERNKELEDLLAQSQAEIEYLTTKTISVRAKLTKELEAANAREIELSKEVQVIKSQNSVMEKRLEEQERELDEFESDFAMARDDARRVVEELRSQVAQLERKNEQLLTDGTVKKVDDLKSKLRQLISQNQRLQKDIETFKSRERKLQQELGLGGWK
jgi:chromosome segregation ATPase